MRTKTLLLTAALSAAGIATSMAQVYSVNMVGYVNLSIVPGFSMIANPLQGTSTTLSALFPTAPEGAGVFKFNGAGYDTAEFLDGLWEGSPITLAPGEGCFFQNPTGVAFVNTFVGEVVLNSSVPVPTGFSVRSSAVPQQAGLSSVLNYPASEGDNIFRFNGAGYTVAEFIDGVWEPSEPQPRVGESFFLFSTSTKNWTRTFTVN